jgi:2-isopropylmalate synthase
MLNFDIQDASKMLTIARSLKKYKPPFRAVGGYRIIDDGVEPEATVQIEANGRVIHEASTGSGPVDALASVLKKSLIPLFPRLEQVKLIDFHAEILDSRRGTSTDVEVTIIFTDGVEVWKVHSLSENINAASFNGLVDGFEYAVIRQSRKKK